MESFTWPLSLLCLGCLATGILGRERVRRRRAESEAIGLRSAQEATLRLLRLATGDQRNLALTLFGHAQTSEPADPSLTGLARRLLDMSEELVEQTETPDALRFLSEETIVLMPVVEFAMAQVAAHLGPSRRAWRSAPALAHTRLQGDRRALNQVLVNVLSGAAAATRDGDWIEISVHTGVQGLSIVVQDEGVGLPVAQNDTHPEESRGIGLRLTLARGLMQAHGGNLTVESVERVGTRVSLVFPLSRLVDQVCGLPEAEGVRRGRAPAS